MGNSRPCVRTPGERWQQHRVRTTGVRKSLKGLAPSVRRVYMASRETAPCTCWSSRQAGWRAGLSGILSSRHVPWIAYVRCREIQIGERYICVCVCRTEYVSPRSSTRGNFLLPCTNKSSLERACDAKRKMVRETTGAKIRSQLHSWR